MSQERTFSDRNSDSGRGCYGLSIPRSKLISRGVHAAESPKKMAQIRDIVVEVNQYGSLKRQAVIDPVTIEGEEITSICLGLVFDETGFSREEREDYDVRVGDFIEVDIFSFRPRITKGARTGSENAFTMPGKCPECGCEIKTRGPDLPFYYCAGAACLGRLKAKVIAFSDSMRIYLNPTLAKELVNKKMIQDPADLYFLKKEDLVRLNKMDEESAKGVLAAIEESRHPEPADIIPAILATGDIPYHVGWKVAEHCDSIDDLLDDAALSRWIQPNYVTRISGLMRDSKTLTFLDKLKSGGVIVPRKRG